MLIGLHFVVLGVIGYLLLMAAIGVALGPARGTTPTGRVRMRTGCLDPVRRQRRSQRNDLGAVVTLTSGTGCAGLSRVRQQRYGSPPEDTITAG